MSSNDVIKMELLAELGDKEIKCVSKAATKQKKKMDERKGSKVRLS